jgi:transcriptional regulator with XRE-family HTH domain
MGKKEPETNELRKTLALNIKKQRKILGLTQEKLAEASNLSFQTINDIEGCRMWVSDKTINKLSQVLFMDAYQLFSPIPQDQAIEENVDNNDLLLELEGKIIRMIKQQFNEAHRQN